MKINWGTGLVVGMVAFMGFILVLVTWMMTDKKFDHDLVTEEYYKQEMALPAELLAEQNVADLKIPMRSEKVKGGYEVYFPQEFDDKKLTGTVFLYRPSNKLLDFEFPLEVSNSRLLIPDSRLVGGRWNITISWTADGKNYLLKKQIIY